MSYVVAGYVAVIGGLALYASRLVLRAREVASRLGGHGDDPAPTERSTS